LQALEQQIEAEPDLQDRQNIEGGFHCVSRVAERFGSYSAM
jgi:hypothetical protein